MPFYSSTSYEQLPAWLRDYAREAAGAARNLGVEEVRRPGASPGTETSSFRARGYVPYTGRRFLDGRDEVRGIPGSWFNFDPHDWNHPTTSLEQKAINLTNSENPFLEELDDFRQQNRGFAQEGLPGSIENYLNPNIGGISSAIAEQGQRKLSEDVLPALEAKYLRLGQHGGRGHKQASLRAAREIQSEILNSQAEARENSYEQSVKAFNQDRARTLESIKASAELRNLLSLAKQGDISALFQAAEYDRALKERPMQVEEQEFRKEQKHPYDSLNFLISALNGVPANAGMSESINIPAPPAPPRSLRSSDYMGMFAQLAPILRRG